MTTSEQFFQSLRSALNHLYDPYFLRKSPLVRLFALGDQPDSPAALQRIINEAIEALAPKPGEPNPSQRQRMYDLILYRYVQQFGQEEVANQLGLSVRHLRREQNAAVFELAAYLWERYRLGTRPFELSEMDANDPGGETEATNVVVADSLPGEIDTVETAVREAQPTAEAEPEGNQIASPVAGDLQWLKEEPLNDPADLGDVLGAVVELSREMAKRRQVTLNVRVGTGEETVDRMLVAAQPVAVRQMLLDLLIVAIPLCAEGAIEISVTRQGGEVITWIDSPEKQALVDRSPVAFTSDEISTLTIARQLAEMSGGQLEYTGKAGFQASLSLPAFRPHTLLVIDDNVDFIQLIQRFLTGTRYKVVGERDPARAIEAVVQHTPDMILLDVMMPRMDGWEVLGRLRRHPSTAHLPVIVCTILAQEELALSLGAAGFVRKPVTQERILAALDQQSAILGRVSH